MITTDLIERLRYESESDALDFKEDQYRFDGATDEEKSELLKDILAFANSWRRTDAYILIGFREVKGSQAQIVGITKHVDDAQLQQFTNSKTQRPIRFAYHALTMDGKNVAVIHIPLQERPFFLTSKYGKVAEHRVYVRRGSSTAVAKPDEVARMGQVEHSSDQISLDVFFADPANRKRIVPTIQSCVLEIPNLKDIPNYSPNQPFEPFRFSVNRPRPEYYRELASYTKLSRLVAPVWLAIENIGTATAHDVRLELKVSGADQGVTMLDENRYPSVPGRESDISGIFMRPMARSATEMIVEQVGADWIAEGRADKVQPKSTYWFRDPVYVGSSAPITLKCDVRVFADNLRSPHEQSLDLVVDSTRERVNLTRILELENERFRRSSTYREFLRQEGLEDKAPDEC
jgi:hypothetical protein